MSQTLISRYGKLFPGDDIIHVHCSCGDQGHSVIISHEHGRDHPKVPRMFHIGVSQSWGMGFWRRLKQAWMYLRYETFFCDAGILLDAPEAKELGQKLVELADKDIAEFGLEQCKL